MGFWGLEMESDQTGGFMSGPLTGKHFSRPALMKLLTAKLKFKYVLKKQRETRSTGITFPFEVAAHTETHDSGHRGGFITGDTH